MKDLLFKSEFYEDIDYLRFFIALVVLIFLSKILQYVYNKYSDSPTNRKSFSSIFVLFAVSIFLIVMTIKSSLALSLGMVGALSIIRFRTAIKEPEQLIYFLGITGVAVAMAAQKEIIGFVVVIVFSLLVISNNRKNKTGNRKTLQHLLIDLKLNQEKLDIDILSELINIDKSGELKCKSFYEDDSGNVRITFSINNLEIIEIRKKIKESLRLMEINHFNIKMIE